MGPRAFQRLRRPEAGHYEGEGELAISAKKLRVVVTVDRDTVCRVREALDELGIGRGYLSLAVNEALAAQRSALERLCALKRRRRAAGPASLASVMLGWEDRVERMARSRGRSAPRDKRADRRR